MIAVIVSLLATHWGGVGGLSMPASVSRRVGEPWRFPCRASYALEESKKTTMTHVQFHDCNQEVGCDLFPDFSNAQGDLQRGQQGSPTLADAGVGIGKSSQPPICGKK